MEALRNGTLVLEVKEVESIFLVTEKANKRYHGLEN